MTDFTLELANGAVVGAPTNSAYNFGRGDFTLEGWFRTTSSGTIVSRKSTAGGAGNGGFLLVLKGDGSFKLATDSGFGFYEITSAPTSCRDGRWHHVAGVRTSGALQLYLDGSPLGATVGNNTGSPCDVSNSGRLVIGGTDQQQEPFNRFTGNLDSVRVWNVARSSADIAGNMNRRLNGHEPGLVGSWTFNGANGADGSPTRNAAVADGQVSFTTPGAPTDRVSTISNGLVAYYPLISDGKDYSGKGHHATSTTGVVFGPGMFGGSATITAANAGVILPLDFPRYADYYTVAAWVSLSLGAPADDKTQSSVAGGLAWDRASGKLTFYFYYDSAGSTKNGPLVLQSSAGLGKAQWHHVAVVYDHDALKLAFYIDRNLVDMIDLAGRISRRDRPHFPSFAVIGGAGGVLGVLNGSVSDVMMLDVAAEKDDINFLGGIMTPQAAQSPPAEPKRGIHAPSPELSLAAADRDSACAPAWWWVIPLIGQIALARAANCAQKPGDAPPSVSDVVAAIYGAFGLTSPAELPAGKKVSRSQAGAPEGMRLHLDVGGEGAVAAVQTGFRDAINLQGANGSIGDGTKQTQTPFGPIPNLVRMAKWEQPYPFEDGFFDYVTMQNAPLSSHNVEEIARVINKDTGEIALWIDVEAFRENIEALAARLRGRVIWNDTDEFHGNAGSSKTTIVVSYEKDQL